MSTLFSALALFAPLALLLALLSACLLSLRLRVVSARRVLGVLHPYANDGGGGERVLWVALRELLARYQLQGWRVVVYTGDAASDDEIRAATLSRFGVDVPESVEFVRLRSRRVVEPSSYPVATLLGQAVGSLLLLLEALARAPPSVLLDTTGYGYCYAAAKALGVRRVGCYVHYPILSSEMVGAVERRAGAHNNAARIASSPALTSLKLAYYRALAAAYGASGAAADVVVANGSWTAGHLRSLWRGAAGRVAVAFPPCDTAALRALPLERRAAPLLLLSVAQFRPEKDHALQLKAFAALLRRASASAGDTPPPRLLLVLAGAVRHEQDAARLAALATLATSLGLRHATADGRAVRELLGGGAEGAEEAEVVFTPNLRRPELLLLLGRAQVGLHTMWNEHFGIGVVELMAAGVPPVAHASGGPLLDIVKPRGEVGLLAATEGEYTEALAQLTLAPRAAQRRAAMAAAARESVATRFSDEAFAQAFCAEAGRLLA